MVLIMKVVGKPSDEELSFLTDEESKIFVRNISKKYEGQSM
jgi:hypothetical protein